MLLAPCTMMGDQVVVLDKEHDWKGFIIFDCIRNSIKLEKANLGSKAWATIPRKTIKHQQGVRDISVHFSDTRFAPEHYIYSDEDCIPISGKTLI